MAARIGEKIPGWVERLLIPAMDSRIRSAVKDEVGHLEKIMNSRFDSVDVKFHGVDGRFDSLEEKFEARFETLDTKIDSLEKRFPVIQEMAEIKARLAQVERSLVDSKPRG